MYIRQQKKKQTNNKMADLNTNIQVKSLNVNKLKLQIRDENFNTLKQLNSNKRYSFNINFRKVKNKRIIEQYERKFFILHKADSK